DVEEAPTRGWRSAPAWLSITATSLSLVPLPVALASGENSVITQNLGLLWTLVVLTLLVSTPSPSTPVKPDVVLV
ncbi:MAG: hypothetical protein KGR25_11460, partial [Chloroflexi bacterium]|nr:hypothetical protein [Chloroflexota bacterium]